MACVLLNVFDNTNYINIAPLNVEWLPHNVAVMKNPSDLIAMRSVKTLQVALKLLAKENPELATKLAIYWQICTSAIFKEIL